MSNPILPIDIITNCQIWANSNSVTGLDLWAVIVRANPHADFGVDENGQGTGVSGNDNGIGEMCFEVITNNWEYAGTDVEDLEDWSSGEGVLAVTSREFIQILDYVKGEYDIVNYVLKDGKIWAVEEQCWADEL